MSAEERKCFLSFLPAIMESRRALSSREEEREGKMLRPCQKFPESPGRFEKRREKAVGLDC